MPDQNGNVYVSDEINLLYSTVVNLTDLAENSYNEAKRSLDTLANGVTDLPLTLVDADIGSSITLSWTGSITPITPSTAPTFLQDYLATLPETAPTVPDATVDLTELTATPPTISELETPGAPTAIGTLEFAALPTLGALPTIDTVIPTISLTALTDEFTWSEPTYTPELKSEIKTELLRVLGGDLGLPQSYWDSVWAESANDLARQQVGRLRNARNRGAASFWALPGETVLAASRAIQDEGAKSLQINRLKQAQTQATMAREDFWQAVERGIAFEQQWIAVHEQLAARSLAAAETLVNLQIGVHNANVAHYNLLLEAAKTEVEIDKAVLDGVLRAYEGELKGAGMDIEQVKARIEKYQAEWAAKNEREKTLVQVFGESVRAWGTQIDGEIKAATFPLNKAEIEARVHGTLFGAVGALASATSAIIGADVANNKMVLDGEIAEIEYDKAKNQANIDIGKLTVAAQEAKARIEVAQAQWIQGQAMDLQKRIAELAYGYAQAAVAASDVSYGRNINASYTDSETASHNEEKVW